MFKVKSKLIIAAMLMFGIVAFTSCKKETIEDGNSITTNSSISEKKLSLTKQDKIEYFNSLGIRHNEVLAFVGNNLDVSRATQKERYNLASEYLGDKISTFDHFLESYPMVDDILENPHKTADIFFPDPEIPYALGNYYNELGAIFATCLQKANDSIEVSPDEFNRMIGALENEVYDNFKVDLNIEENTADEASMFLGACAIARYSYQYWNNAVNDKSNPWYGFFNDELSKKPGGFWAKVWRAVKVGVCDAAGFVVGATNITVTSNGPGFSFDIEDGFKKAGKWSSSVPKVEE